MLLDSCAGTRTLINVTLAPRTLAAALSCLLFMFTACRHKSAMSSVSTNTSTMQQASMVPDQVNTAGWDKAWTNLVNDAEQSFKPSLAKLMAVEVELLVGNPGAPEDDVTLTVLDETGQTLAVVTRSVSTANCDQVMFLISKNGLEITPGQSYRLKLTGGTTFGWKYVVGGYEKGAATFNGKPLLADARSTFLFRTFGSR
jgi:hypothetical protein